MSILKKINKSRMTIMRKLARKIGTSHVDKIDQPIDPLEVKRVLISRPNNRLGNLLLITPLLQEVSETFPNCKIDLFVRGNLAPILFENYKNVDRIIKLPKKPFNNLLKYMTGWLSLKKRRYDIVINVVNYSSSGRLSTQFASSSLKFFGEIDDNIQLQYTDHKHMAKAVVYNFRKYLSKLGLEENTKPVAPLDLKLTTTEIAQGKEILSNLVQNNKRTICLFTYATGKKCYSKEWWSVFYERLKAVYPNYNIIEVLPIENVSQIGFKAPSFYSKDVREIGSLIANTQIFIGADSGIMHLSSSVHTPTIGLFSISRLNVYQPYGNNSFGINTKVTTIEDWIKTIDDTLHKTDFPVEAGKVAV